MLFLKKFYGTKSDSYTRLLFAMSLVLFLIGIFAIFTRQPMSWYDEEIHYARSVELANGDLLTKRNGDNTQYGGDVSTSQDTFIDRAFKSKLFDPKIDALDGDWDKNYSDLEYEDKTVFRNSVTSMTNIPLIYAPYVTVAFVNKVFHFNVATEFKLMKLAGFLLSFTMVLLAVSKLPFAKLSLLLLALTPPYVIGMASISADTIFLGAIPLFIAYSLQLFFKAKKEEITWREILIHSGIGLLVTVSKPPSCLLVSFVLLILFIAHKNKKISIAKTAYMLSVVAFLAFLTVFWLWLVREVDASKYFGSSGNMGEQLSFIVQHPLQFIKVLIKTLTAYNFFQLQFGYAEYQPFMYAPTFVGITTAIGIIFSLFIKDDEQPTYLDNLELRYWNYYSVFLCAVIFLLIFTAGYLQSSAVGGTEILGVQPRYFLPFWVMLFLFPNKIRIERPMPKTIIIASALSAQVVYLGYVLLQLRN